MPEPTSVFTIERLSTAHDRTRFECGVPALNDYIRRQARQDMERAAATVYVLVPHSDANEIAGFYTLSSTAVKLDTWPAEVVRKLPRYPLTPATLLGRLAVDVAYRGQGLGERLLVDALGRSLEASRSVASVAVIVDAKDAAGAEFYRRYGFKPFPEQPLRLFIAMQTVAALVA